QWFMLEPYGFIQDPCSHGDIPLWPLKALCDTIECTGDLALLSEPAPWRDGTGESSLFAHCETLLACLEAQFIPGTALIRLGEGDWNDSLQPADASLKERMVSSWTVALFFQQLTRYAAILRRAGEAAHASRLDALAEAMRADFNRDLIRDGVLAGYAIFTPDGRAADLLLHPSDRRTGVHYSLIPMNCAIAGGLFTSEQARHHLGLIQRHLLFPDGVRLMDRPLTYGRGEAGRRARALGGAANRRSHRRHGAFAAREPAPAQLLVHQQRRRLPRPLRRGRALGPRESRHRARRWRLAHLFLGAGALYPARARPARGPPPALRRTRARAAGGGSGARPDAGVGTERLSDS